MAVREDVTKRVKLDEVGSNDAKPSELYYLMRIRKTPTRDDVVTAVRAAAGDLIESAEVELGAELTEK